MSGEQKNKMRGFAGISRQMKSLISGFVPRFHGPAPETGKGVSIAFSRPETAKSPGAGS
jgi:hypothetical protein